MSSRYSHGKPDWFPEINGFSSGPSLPVAWNQTLLCHMHLLLIEGVIEDDVVAAFSMRKSRLWQACCLGARARMQEL